MQINNGVVARFIGWLLGPGLVALASEKAINSLLIAIFVAVLQHPVTASLRDSLLGLLVVLYDDLAEPCAIGAYGLLLLAAGYALSQADRLFSHWYERLVTKPCAAYALALGLSE